MSSRRIDTVEVAKLIRATLKARLPAAKFRVQSDRYAGGSSIRVTWTDGPTTKLVESLIGHVHGATFDGMIDLKSYHDSELDGEAVHYGNDFLFCNRDLSDGFIARVAREFTRRTGNAIPETMGEASKMQPISGDWRYGDMFLREFAGDRTVWAD
jgi:hypothetical protein